MFKNIIAVVVGVVSGLVLIGLVQYAIGQLSPLPEGVDPNDYEQLSAYLRQAPTSKFLLIILSYFTGAIMSGFVSAGIKGTSNPKLLAYVSGSILLGFGILNMLMLPHPIWFWILSSLIYLPGAYLGYLLTIKLQAK
jgi:hypothetical protein